MTISRAHKNRLNVKPIIKYWDKTSKKSLLIITSFFPTFPDKTTFSISYKMKYGSKLINHIFFNFDMKKIKLDYKKRSGCDSFVDNSKRWTGDWVWMGMFFDGLLGVFRITFLIDGYTEYWEKTILGIRTSPKSQKYIKG